jgi:hypothetical protein
LIQFPKQLSIANDAKIIMTPISKSCCLFLILFLTFLPLGIVQASTESFNVGAGKEIVSKINVASGDKVQITFVTTGLESSNLSFSIIFPNSTLIILAI